MIWGGLSTVTTCALLDGPPRTHIQASLSGLDSFRERKRELIKLGGESFCGEGGSAGVSLIRHTHTHTHTYVYIHV